MNNTNWDYNEMALVWNIKRSTVQLAQWTVTWGNSRHQRKREGNRRRKIDRWTGRQSRRVYSPITVRQGTEFELMWMLICPRCYHILWRHKLENCSYIWTRLITPRFTPSNIWKQSLTQNEELHTADRGNRAGLAWNINGGRWPRWCTDKKVAMQLNHKIYRTAVRLQGCDPDNGEDRGRHPV